MRRRLKPVLWAPRIIAFDSRCIDSGSPACERSLSQRLIARSLCAIRSLVERVIKRFAVAGLAAVPGVAGARRAVDGVPHDA